MKLRQVGFKSGMKERGSYGRGEINGESTEKKVADRLVVAANTALLIVYTLRNDYALCVFYL